MNEIAESHVLAKQGNLLFKKVKILHVKALLTPHTFCWMNHSKEDMASLLLDKTIEDVRASAHYLRFMFQDGTELSVAEDVSIRYIKIEEESQKHQLFIEFDNGYALEFKVKLYGFILFGREGELKRDFPYYRKAIEAINPLSEAFTYPYFIKRTELDGKKGSVKQQLATDQRLPGLGNGTLQDILFHAKLSPKRKVSTLDESDRLRLYHEVIQTIDRMILFEGRDTTVDFLNEKGRYEVIMRSDRTHCPLCNTPLIKEAYLGGKVIYCPQCQS